MSGLERAAYVSMLGFAAAPQFSIAASGILLGLSALLWLAVVIINRERIEVPRMFWPLAAYAGVTLVASLFSANRAVSFADCKQLLLFAIVPITYRLFRGERSLTVVDVVITVGALNAVYGIVQYGILDYDNVARRVQGNLGHYMTYSGVIMLVACIAVARVMFRRRERIWAALVPPGGPRRPGPDPQPERLGRRVRRDRHAVSSQGSPIRVPDGRVAAGRDGLAHRLRTCFSLRSVLFDAVAQGHLRR